MPREASSRIGSRPFTPDWLPAIVDPRLLTAVVIATTGWFLTAGPGRTAVVLIALLAGWVSFWSP